MTLYEKNLEAIRHKDEDLYNALMDLDTDKLSDSCGADIAKNGSHIIYILRDDRRYYLNSRYNPDTESDNYVLKYKDVMDYAFLCFMGLSNGMIAGKLLHALPEHVKLFFYEPSVEIFYTALNNCDMTELFEASRVQITVSGMNDRNMDVKISKNLDATTYLISSCEVLPVYNQLFPDETAELKNIFRFQASTESSNIATIESFGSRLVYNDIYNMRSMLNCNCEEQFENVFPLDRPAIIVSAGPSLEKNAHYLNEAKGYMLIIAVDSAMPYLARNNIFPDVVLAVDAEKPVDLFLDDLTKTIPWVVSADVNYKILEQTTQKVIFACSDSNYHNKIFRLNDHVIGTLSGGGCVASYAVALATAWGYRKLVLVGQDFAIKPDKVHAGDLAIGTGRLEEKRIPVEGYYGDTVYTLADYDYYRQWFESVIRINKKELEIINATEGGAKIQGSTQMSMAEVLKTYKKETFDFENVIRDMPPVISADLKEDVVNIWRDSCNTLDFLKDSISQGMDLTKKGAGTIRSGIYSKDDIMAIYNKLCDVIEKCDEKDEIAFLDRMTEAEHARILTDIYIVEDTTDEEICRIFEKMMQYLEAMHDSVDEVKGMFEKIIGDVSQ